jgi:hypothetical protein
VNWDPRAASWAFFKNFANRVKVGRLPWPITVVRIVSDTASLPAGSLGCGRQGPVRGTEVIRMRQSRERSYAWRRTLLAIGFSSAFGVTGCQVDIGGQTLPSPHYQQDDIQYFPPGPEFKLSREAAAQKAFSENQAAEEH